MSLPLKNKVVLNTRPQAQADKLTQKIAELGGKSILLPLLEIAPITKPTEQASPFPLIDIVIFISANAVKYGAEFLKSNWQTEPLIAAIGQSTATQLTLHQLPVDIIAPNSDSTSLTTHPRLQNISNKTIAIVKGLGGRQILQNFIKKNNARLITFDVYQRLCPNNLQDDIKTTWKNNNINIILISSVESMHNLLQQTPKELLKVIQNTPWLVLSNRIKDEAIKYGIKDVMVTENSNIYAALKSWNKETTNDPK